MTFWLASTANRLYKASGNKISYIYHPALRYIFRFLAMTIFGQGEPRGVSKGELACLRPFLADDQGTPDWIDLFVGRCLQIQGSTKGKIAIGGMITLLIWYLGIEIPDDCVVLDTNATIFYDKPTLRRIRSLQYTDHRNCSLVIPNGRVVLLSPFPRNLFDVRTQDTAKSLCTITHNYSLQHPIDPAPMAAGVPINLDEEEIDEGEEEEYVPSEEQEDMAHSPAVDSGFDWSQYDQRFSTIGNRFDELGGRLDRTDSNLQTFQDAYDGDMYNLDTRL